jgi:hypothetical protein
VKKIASEKNYRMFKAAGGGLYSDKIAAFLEKYNGKYELVNGQVSEDLKVPASEGDHKADQAGRASTLHADMTEAGLPVTKTYYIKDSGKWFLTAEIKDYPKFD